MQYRSIFQWPHFFNQIVDLYIPIHLGRSSILGETSLDITNSSRMEDYIIASQEASWVEALEKLEAGIASKAKVEEEAKKEALLDIAAEETSWVKAFER